MQTDVKLTIAESTCTAHAGNPTEYSGCYILFFPLHLIGRDIYHIFDIFCLDERENPIAKLQKPSIGERNQVKEPVSSRLLSVVQSIHFPEAVGMGDGAGHVVERQAHGLRQRVAEREV